jgi:hypothetical protein
MVVRIFNSWGKQPPPWPGITRVRHFETTLSASNRCQRRQNLDGGRMKCLILRAAWVSIALLQTFATSAFAKDPDCLHKESWPISMAFTHLRDAGIFKLGEIDPSQATITRLASEKLRKNLYHQVHLVKFKTITGKELNVITVSDTSWEECSMTGVDVYLINKKYGDYNNGH